MQINFKLNEILIGTHAADVANAITIVLILNDDRAAIKSVKLLTLVQIIYIDSSLLVDIEMMRDIF